MFMPACHTLQGSQLHCTTDWTMNLNAYSTIITSRNHCSVLQPRQQQQQQLRTCRRQQQQQQQQQQLLPNQRVQASPFVTNDTVTQGLFEEEQYQSTQQGQRRKAWQAAVRSATGRRHQMIWEPELEYPLLLADVAVVLVGPKQPISCGTVSRSCSCFEVDDLRLVQPRCTFNTKGARSVSKGAQWILYRTKIFESLTDALSDVDLSVAMTRWLPDQPNSLPNIPSLLQQPGVQQMLQKPLGTLDSPQQQQQDQMHRADTQQQQQQGQGACPPAFQQQYKPLKVALVFGREEYGLSDEEVAACDLACAIPIGRLQESLSLSHAVTIVLSQLYQARLSATTTDPLAGQYNVAQPSQLAEGYDSGSGAER